MEKYRNKRIMYRRGGKFRKATMEDVGLTGVCPVCNHFTTRYYDGPPGDPFPDPRRFRARCWTCEPETDQEKEARQAYEDSRPKAPTFKEIFEKLAKEKENEQP